MVQKKTNKKPKKKTSKLKVFAISFLITTIGGGALGLTGYLNWNRITAWLNQTRAYSYDEVQELIEDARGSDSESVSAFQTTIDELRAQITTLNATVAEKTTQISGLTADIASLQDTLLNQSTQSEAEKEELQKQITELTTSLNTALADKEELLIQVDNLNQLIAQYAVIGENQVTVSVYDKGELSKIMIVEKNINSITLVAPEDTDTLRFAGYSVNGADIDPTNYSFTENTVINIEYEALVNVEILGNIYQTWQRVGTAFDFSEFEEILNSDPTQIFNGSWTIDEVTTGEEIIIGYDPITLVANFDTTYNVLLDGEVLGQVVNGSLNFELPTLEQEEGVFKFYVNDEENRSYTNTSNYSTITEDLNLHVLVVEKYTITIMWGVESSFPDQYISEFPNLYYMDTYLFDSQYQAISNTLLSTIFADFENEYSGVTISSPAISLNSLLDASLDNLDDITFNSNTTLYLTVQ